MRGEVCDVCKAEPARYLAIGQSGARDKDGELVFDMSANVGEKCARRSDAIRKVLQVRQVSRGA